MFTNGQQQNTQLIAAVLSCVQNAYLGDWLCVKLPFIFLKKYGFCTMHWWSEHFPWAQFSPQADRKSKVKPTAPNSFTVRLKSLLRTHIHHWVGKLLNSNPKICPSLVSAQGIFMIIPRVLSSLNLLFLYKWLKQFMPGKDAEFFSPQGGKFVKGYLYRIVRIWNSAFPLG